MFGPADYVQLTCIDLNYVCAVDSSNNEGFRGLVQVEYSTTNFDFVT